MRSAEGSGSNRLMLAGANNALSDTGIVSSVVACPVVDAFAIGNNHPHHAEIAGTSRISDAG
jgi:hypothetical protein